MAEWQEFDPTKVIPDDLLSVANDAASLAGILAPILDVAANVVDIASLFVKGYDDAQKSIIEAFQNLLLSTVQQLLETGVYVLPYIPASWKLNTTPSAWLGSVAGSLSDTYDSNRPILVDPYAYVGCVVVMTTTANYPSLFSKLFNLFGMLIPSADQVAAWPTRGNVFEVVEGVGRDPNWARKRIADIVPGVGQIVDTLLNFSGAVSSAAGASDIYGLFANQLRNKATLLQQISTLISGIVSSIEDSMGFSDAYLLPIMGQGDKAWLQSEIVTSTGGPRNVASANYSAGVTFLTTGGTTAPAELLLSLFGAL